ncbi:MAG: Mur ligase [Myxococcales bacterium]|nr:Mur ligase [Myxococcales bacterium]
MRLVDSRRLTGPNLYAPSPGAIAEVAWDAAWLAGGGDPAQAIARWREQLARMLAPLGLAPTVITARRFTGGAALFVAAPWDLLTPTTELNEWAVASAAQVLAGAAEPPLEPARAELALALTAAHRPHLAELVRAARARGVPVLLDDDRITIGSGADLIGFTADEPLPAPAELPWAALAAMPIALVTGTNGKTTTTRLVARMARLAGRHPGVSSSDGVAVDERFIERGDWSGPDAARRVLRHPGVDLAVLEVARGGILRRGLAIEAADAAVITNVTADHLGGYGVDDLATMTQAKAVAARAARTVVLNADDPELVALAPTLTAPIVWFGRDPDGAVLAGHVARGGGAWAVRAGQIVHWRGGGEAARAVIAVDDVPLTFGGRAGYNVDNALAAAALATALGLPDAAVVAGLRAFTSSPDDNPGRGNLIDVRGVQVLVDFGHNPAAVRGVIALAASLCTGRLFVSLGMPGDRPDDELVEVARAIAAARPHQVRVHELPDHQRGRAPTVVPRLLTDAMVAAGLDVDAVRAAAGEVAAVAAALGVAGPGDVVLVLVHLDDDVYRLLAERA